MDVCFEHSSRQTCLFLKVLRTLRLIEPIHRNFILSKLTNFLMLILKSAIDFEITFQIRVWNVICIQEICFEILRMYFSARLFQFFRVQMQLGLLHSYYSCLIHMATNFIYRNDDVEFQTELQNHFIFNPSLITHMILYENLYLQEIERFFFLNSLLCLPDRYKRKVSTKSVIISTKSNFAAFAVL